MNQPISVRTVALACLASLLLGGGTILWLSWTILKPQTVVETYAPEIIQKDHSRVLEKKPDKNAKPPHQIPKGAKVERISYAVVQPYATADTTTPGSNGQASPQKPSSVRVDMTLVRMEDGQRRVIASSPDGEVVGGMDIPVENTERPKELRNAIGLHYTITSEGGTAFGPSYERDMGLLRVGVDLSYIKYPELKKRAVSATVRGLIRF